MSEELCADCPFNKFTYLEAEADLKLIRLRSTDPDSVKAIGRLANAPAILEALKRDRPERCRLLRTLLPGPPNSQGRALLFNDCAEVALIDAAIDPAQLD